MAAVEESAVTQLESYELHCCEPERIQRSAADGIDASPALPRQDFPFYVASLQA